jgi:1-acyl-sn-glycerol-3-phosphate acyltransferase
VARPFAALRDWLARASALVPAKDAVGLFAPPVLIAKIARYALAPHKLRAPADDVDARDAALIDLITPPFRALARVWFRPRYEGLENVPANGAALLVGNHNGGLVPSDSFLTGMAIRDHFLPCGVDRAVYGLAHDLLFDDATLRRYAQRVGMLRAGHAGARRAFDRGALVLVYPGSDYDAFRAFKDRGKVFLGGRVGFLQLALRAQVPIVPVVSVGTHEQFVVLTRGDAIARRLNLHRWARTDVFPIALTVPWGIVPAFVPYLPLPAQTTIAFGAPMKWDVGPDAADDGEFVARAYEEVRATMQAMLDRLMVGRTAWIG